MILSFVLIDQTEIKLNYVGDEFEFNDIQLDPYNVAPLSLIINKKTPVKGKFKVRVVGQDGLISDFIYDSKIFSNEHSLDILGLYPDYKNQIEILFTNKDGKVRLNLQFMCKLINYLM